MIKVGFSKVDLERALTPKLPIMEDRVEAISLYIESKTAKALWVVLDFMDFNRKITDTLKTAIKDSIGLEFDSIHIVTTHNHGGGEPDLSILSRLVADGARNAKSSAVPALMRYVFTSVEKQVNIIRRIFVPEIDGVATQFYGSSDETNFNAAPFIERVVKLLEDGKKCYSYGIETERDFLPFNPGDEEITAVQFVSSENNAPIGSIVRFAAHAVCCNQDGQYSSDYPFYVRKKMEESFGGTAMFFNGPCGDIAPGVTNKTDGMQIKLGEYIAECAISALDKIPFEELTEFNDCKIEIPLPVRNEVINNNVDIPSEKPTSITEMRKYLDRCELKGLMNFLRSKYAEGENELADNISTFLGLLRLNELVFAAFPGESFSVTGDAVKQAFPDVDICTVTEHERTVMYLPPEEDFYHGSYEANCKTTAPDAEEIFRQNAIDAIKKFL